MQKTIIFFITLTMMLSGSFAQVFAAGETPDGSSAVLNEESESAAGLEATELTSDTTEAEVEKKNPRSLPIRIKAVML